MFPTAPTCAAKGNGCAAIPGEAGLTCLCDIDVDIHAVFTKEDALPNTAEVLSQLHIGAPHPDHFDTYTACTTDDCTAGSRPLMA